MEKLSFLGKRMGQLENSQVVFKNRVLGFIELLRRGFGTMSASHHNNVLSLDMVFSDAQYQCFECQDTTTSISWVKLTPHENATFDSMLVPSFRIESNINFFSIDSIKQLVLLDWIEGCIPEDEVH